MDLIGGHGATGNGGNARKSDRRADRGRADGKRECNAYHNRNNNTHHQGLQEGCPADKFTDKANRRANVGCYEDGEHAAHKDRYKRGHKDIDLGFLGNSLAALDRHNGNEQNGKRATRATLAVCRKTDKRRGIHDKRRGFQGKGNGNSHRGSCRLRAVPADRFKEGKRGDKANGVKDRGNEKRAEKAKRHGAKRINAVSLCRKDDILSRKKTQKRVLFFFGDFLIVVHERSPFF